MNAPLRSLIMARGLRDFGDGFVAVLLPVYLTALGFSSFQIGLLAGIALFGSALMTLAIGILGGRYDHRSLLIFTAGLMALTGVAFSLSSAYAVLLLVAFLESVNPSAGTASFFVPVEHAVLAREAGDSNRTGAFAQYSLVGGLAGAAGALAAVMPPFLTRMGWSQLEGLRLMFAFYALLGVAGGLLYSRIPPSAPLPHPAHTPALGPSRKIVYKLAGLFSLDAFAGGFLVQSLFALWLFHKGLSLSASSVFFFGSGILSSLSYPVASWLAKRFGLVNTMVYTHIPASLCLIGAAFAPSLDITLGLLLLRAALSQMDVPARSSYVMAVVSERERAAAASFTLVPRSLAASLSPALRGGLFATPWAATPLVICGSLKILYDLLLLWQFGSLKPPEDGGVEKRLC
jgi:MFS family permease